MNERTYKLGVLAISAALFIGIASLATNNGWSWKTDLPQLMAVLGPFVLWFLRGTASDNKNGTEVSANP